MRIDFIYIRNEMFDECAEWGITPSPIPTDHSIISAGVVMLSDLIVGKGRWAIPTRLVKNGWMKQLIQRAGLELQERPENLVQQTPRMNPQWILKEFKDEIRQSLWNHERRTQPMITKKIETLTATLRETLNDERQPEEET